MSGHMSTGNRVSRTWPCVTTAVHGVIPILTVGAVGAVGNMRPPDAACPLPCDPS
jgi:hypothetical protein